MREELHLRRKIDANVILIGMISPVSLRDDDKFFDIETRNLRAAY